MSERSAAAPLFSPALRPRAPRRPPSARVSPLRPVFPGLRRAHTGPFPGELSSPRSQLGAPRPGASSRAAWAKPRSRGAADSGRGLGTTPVRASLPRRLLGSDRGFPGVPSRDSLGAPARQGASRALGEGRAPGRTGATSARGSGTPPRRDFCPGNLCSPGAPGRLRRGVQLQVVGALDPAQGPCRFFVRAAPSQTAWALQLPAALHTLPAGLGGAVGAGARVGGSAESAELADTPPTPRLLPQTANVSRAAPGVHGGAGFPGLGVEGRPGAELQAPALERPPKPGGGERPHSTGDTGDREGPQPQEF